jgi:hypothetical protein
MNKIIKITSLPPLSVLLSVATVAMMLTIATATNTTMVYGQITTPTTANTTTSSINATNATAVTAPTPTIITQLIGMRGEVIPLHAENIQFQQEDPLFAKLVQVINDCMNFVVAQDQEGHIDQLDNNRKFSCDIVIRQGVEQFCGFSPRSDILECAEANQMHLYYMITAGASGFPI